MARQICSNCGYEGRGRQIGERSGGTLARVAGMVLMLPIYTIWKALGRRGGAQCPHCSMPTMVKLNSDAGRLVRRRIDIELGLINIAKPEEKKEAVVPQSERPTEVKEKKKSVNPEEW